MLIFRFFGYLQRGAGRLRARYLLLAIVLPLSVMACGSSEDIASLPEAGAPQPAAFAPGPFQYPGGPDGFEGPGGDNSPGSAGTIAVGGVQNRTLFPSGDQDYVAVDLTAGVTYEISSNQLNPQSDTRISLFDVDGVTLIASNDDYIGYDSRVQVTPAVSGTYFIQVYPFSTTGVGGYTLGVRVFTDNDGDSYSPFYDCDDTNAAVRPFVIDTPGNGIDEDCNGVDGLVATVPDAAEVDDTTGQAKPMVLEVAQIYERIYQSISYGTNARTIHVAGNEDHFSVTVPGLTWYRIELLAWSSGTPELTWLDSDGTTVLGVGTFSLNMINGSSSARSTYVRVRDSGATATLAYVPYLSSYGTDLDGDGKYSWDWAFARDCDDADPTVFVGAAETMGDGIDSNCNGQDDT